MDYVSAWYWFITAGFVGYSLFVAIINHQYRSQAAIYSVLLFASMGIGTAAVALNRMHGLDSDMAPLFFNMQRISYIGVLLAGWLLIDHGLVMLNGYGIPMRRFWRFWNLLRTNK